MFPTGSLRSGPRVPLAARGSAAVIFALKGACDPVRVARFRHHWISVGQIGKATRLFRSEGCRDIIFIGSLSRPALSEIRLDWGTLRVMGSLIASFRGGDDHLLSGVGRIFEQDGFRMVGVKDAAPESADIGTKLGKIEKILALLQSAADAINSKRK